MMLVYVNTAGIDYRSLYVYKVSVDGVVLIGELDVVKLFGYAVEQVDRVELYVIKSARVATS